MKNHESILGLALTCLVLGGAACQSAQVAGARDGESQREELSAASPPPPTTDVPPAEPRGTSEEDPFVRLLASLGVRFSPQAQTLEVAGWVNMQDGLVEVFACAPQGKTHESVVVLDCTPSGLHAGLLAMGLEPGRPVEFVAGQGCRPPTGDPVEIEVRWVDEQGVERSARAEDWIWDEKRQSSMPRAPWVFAGSFFQPLPSSGDSSTYAADYIKSLATTYFDASSVLENPHADGLDDTVYYANSRTVPPKGTALRAVFRRAR